MISGLRLGPVVEPERLAALCRRADDLALGRVRNPASQLQRDTGGDVAFQARHGPPPTSTVPSAWTTPAIIWPLSK